MATKLITPRKNEFNVTGIIVKNDAYINSTKSVARFRIAACSYKDSPSCFFDCVIFSKDNNRIPENLLKRGTKVEINGYFHMDAGTPASEGQKAYPSKIELVVNSIKENTPVEVEVKDEDVKNLPGDGENLVVEDGAIFDDLPEDTL